MTDEQIRKLLGEERYNAIRAIIERERKIAEILERQDEFTKAVRRTHKQRASIPLSKLVD